GEAGFLAQRAAGVREPVLRQIADGQPRGLDDRAAVRLVDPGEHLEERRLAGAVGAAQADALAVVDLPGEVVEQDPIAERFGKGGELNHGCGGPDGASKCVILAHPTRRTKARPVRPQLLARSHNAAARHSLSHRVLSIAVLRGIGAMRARFYDGVTPCAHAPWRSARSRWPSPV